MGLMWTAAIIWTARINTGLELVVFSGCRAMVDTSIAPNPSTPTSSGVLLKGFLALACLLRKRDFALDTERYRGSGDSARGSASLDNTPLPSSTLDDLVVLSPCVH